MTRLESALRAWWQLVADEAAGILPPIKVVKARYDAVVKVWDHAGYLDAVERWLGEGKPCPLCGTAKLCDISMTEPEPGPLYLTVTFQWDEVG